MYTEENEFDYNAYLNEDDDNNGSNNSFFNIRLIIKIMIIIFVLILIIFLVFKIKNHNYSKEENPVTGSNPTDTSLVFNNNLNLLKGISEEYFFAKGNYPKEVNETVKVKVNDLISKGYLTELKDGNNQVCGYNTSYIEMTRNIKDYLLEINLSCINRSDSARFYYNLEFSCLTCNGEAYISPKEDDEKEPNDNNNNSSDNTPSLVCKEFGPWTDEYKNDDNLEVDTRTLVKAYKDTVTYGDWSIPSETPILESDTLEVKTVEGVKSVTTLGEWSELSKEKPESLPGRQIKTSKKTSTSYQTKCSTSTYTVERTTWDASATKCVSKGIGKVTCTYKKTTCPKVKKTKTTTYYQYQDTIVEEIPTTYYLSRTIDKVTDYTDYILESEIPEGYQKLSGSEKIEYRYREKCVSK